jgi:hypothetical protein
MAKSVKPEALSKALEKELTIYNSHVTEAIDEASNSAVKKLVQITKATAPVGARGSYRRNIASKLLEKGKRGSKYVWYVKAPDHRLTHLLVRPHATKNGGMTKVDPFLQNAVDQVLPEYEEQVKEAIKNG